MKHLLSIKAKFFLFFNLLCLSALSTQATANTEPVNAAPTDRVYSVQPDYRKCDFPVCGGWFLTPVNQHSLTPENEKNAYEHSLLEPTTLYVSYINYQQMGLTTDQQLHLQELMHRQQVLLRGNTSGSMRLTSSENLTTLHASDAWVAANKQPAIGPYQKITSTGIVCISTPCPYYQTQLINGTYSGQFHQLKFGQAGLTGEQIGQAWQAVSTEGLMITGTTYEFTGFSETGAQPGRGIGIHATQVFFRYPSTN